MPESKNSMPIVEAQEKEKPQVVGDRIRRVAQTTEATLSSGLRNASLRIIPRTFTVLTGQLRMIFHTILLL